MKVQGQTVLAMTIGSSVTGFVRNQDAETPGNGVINVSTRRPFDGLVLENSFQETVLFACQADSYSGGTAIGNESFLITGTGQEPDVFAFDWPLGSDGQVSISAINGNADNSLGNILTNSGFDKWSLALSVNAPNKWTIVVGSATITQENTITYDGVSALKITGN